MRFLRGVDAVNPDAPGTVVAQGTTGETVTTSAGLRVWAGKAGDPFWIEPDVVADDPKKVVERCPAIWTQLRAAAGGRSERGAFQGNRAS